MSEGGLNYSKGVESAPIVQGIPSTRSITAIKGAAFMALSVVLGGCSVQANANEETQPRSEILTPATTLQPIQMGKIDNPMETAQAGALQNSDPQPAIIQDDVARHQKIKKKQPQNKPKTSSLPPKLNNTANPVKPTYKATDVVNPWDK